MPTSQLLQRSTLTSTEVRRWALTEGYTLLTFIQRPPSGVAGIKHFLSRDSGARARRSDRTHTVRPKGPDAPHMFRRPARVNTLAGQSVVCIGTRTPHAPSDVSPAALSQVPAAAPPSATHSPKRGRSEVAASPSRSPNRPRRAGTPPQSFYDYI